MSASENPVVRLDRIAAAAVALRDQPHLVTIRIIGWDLMHSLGCRVDGMHECHINAALQDLDEPPMEPGRYAVSLLEGQLVYSPAPDSDPAADLLQALEAAGL